MFDEDGPLPHSGLEWMFLGLAVVVAAAGTMMYVLDNPGAPWQLEAAAQKTSQSLSAVTGAATGLPGNLSNETLHISSSDVEYLNRRYRELNLESQSDRVGEEAYCLYLVDNRIKVHAAGTIEASEQKVKYTTENCPLVQGQLHLHPPYSRPVLSGPDTSASSEGSDKETFLSNSHYELMCVQAGIESIEAGKPTTTIKCYTKPESGGIDDTFPEVEVVIVEN